MDMSSLQSGLPRHNTDPANVAFREAALKLTTLYKASQQSRHEGYLDAIDEVCARFMDTSGEIQLESMRVWLNDRRRRDVNSGTSVEGGFGNNDISEDAEMAAALRQSEALGAYDIEAVIPPPLLPSSPPTEVPARRARFNSPITRTPRAEASDGREDARRERQNVKRRVFGGLESVPDPHKRGRFG